MGQKERTAVYSALDSLQGENVAVGLTRGLQNGPQEIYVAYVAAGSVGKMAEMSSLKDSFYQR